MTAPERIDLGAIKQRADAASEGPWIAVTDNGRKNGIGIVGRAVKRGTGEAVAVFAGADSAQRNADARFTAQAREDVPALVGELTTVLRLVRDLVDAGDCWFDHHGGCQAHGYLSLEPGEMCPHAEGKQFLAKHGFGTEMESNVGSAS